MAIYHFRKINVYVAAFLIALLIFLLSSPYVAQSNLGTFDPDGNNLTPPTSEVKDKDAPFSEDPPNMSGHYNLLFVVTSTIDAIRQRKLLREALFGIKNNLKPCTRQDGNVYYKFVIPPYKVVEKGTLRDFTAEFVEYDDIVEFPNISGQDFQESILSWAQGLGKKGITYNHLVIINDKTLINLEKLQQILEGSVIRGSTLTMTQKRMLVWGSFMMLDFDDMAIILGRDAVAPILESKKSIKVVNSNFTNMITRAFQYYQQNPNDSGLFLVNDDVGIVEFPNAIENVPIKTTVAVGHIFEEDDMKGLFEHLSVSKTVICHPRNDPNKLNIAVVTSSFVYNDLCMLPAARLTAENKRRYAERHGYSFVGRSSEFANQIYKSRKTVWGKIDGVEKVLPHYDWLFWLDMDTVIMNYNVTIESLIEKFTELVGGKEKFENKHLVVARPSNDRMINAGVFLIRNSEWSREFLRLTQTRRDLYKSNMYEQRAMWDLMRQPEWIPGTIFLDQDDHTFNTFPKRYNKGDFVVHYAPDGCPSKPILDAIGKYNILEKNPEVEVSLDHIMDH